MLNKFFSNELKKEAAMLFICMNIFNFLNFLFHFSMGRLLGPSDYGTIAVLMSIIYIYSVPTEAIQTFISRYTSKFNLKKEYGKIKFLMFKSLRKGFRISVWIFLLSIVVAIFLSKFLNINFWLIFIVNIFIFYLMNI